MKLGWNKTIFRRLMTSHLFVVFLGLGIVGFILPNVVKGYIYDASQQELLRQAKKVNLSIQEFQTLNDEMTALLLFFDQTFDRRIWIFDASGKIIATSVQDEVSVGKSVSQNVVAKVLEGGTVSSGLQFEGLTEPMLSVVVPWGKEDHLYGGIVLHAPVKQLQDTVSKVREAVLWLTLIGMLLAIITVSYVSWEITRPLQKITRSAAEVSAGKYKLRLEGDVPEEYEDLISTLNTLASKLERIDEERKKSEQTVEDLLANISHELRTPLTTIRGFLEALQDGLIPEAGRTKYYDLMYQEMLYMNRLVDDLLDLLKLEKAGIVLSIHPVDVKHLIDKLAFAFGPDAREKGLELQVHAPEALPQAYADVDRLEQIISNLLKNAIKFTDQGQVDLTVQVEQEMLLIEVSDTGCGISETDQQRIWERFFKADRGRSRQNKGAGLGLAIVKELVELHNGTISVHSKLDQGTTFRVRLPCVHE